MEKTVVAHLSDIHVGEPYFSEEKLLGVIDEVNRLDPDIVIVSGDLTNLGLGVEYDRFKDYARRFEPRRVYYIPGNHDSRNVGYIHFERKFGARHHAIHVHGITFVFVDSSMPDSNEGRIGREHYGWIREQFAKRTEYRVFVMHHHLISVPDTGRERNIVHDAGDLLRVLIEAKVDLVLSGHKHVPYQWHFEDMLIANTGSASSMRLRGEAMNSYNIIEIDNGVPTVYTKVPGQPREHRRE